MLSLSAFNESLPVIYTGRNGTCCSPCCCDDNIVSFSDWLYVLVPVCTPKRTNTITWGIQRTWGRGCRLCRLIHRQLLEHGVLIRRCNGGGGGTRHWSQQGRRAAGTQKRIVRHHDGRSSKVKFNPYKLPELNVCPGFTIWRETASFFFFFCYKLLVSFHPLRPLNRQKVALLRNKNTRPLSHIQLTNKSIYILFY